MKMKIYFMSHCVFCFALGCVVTNWKQGNLCLAIPHEAKEAYAEAEKVEKRLNKNVKLGPYILRSSDDFSEFILSSENNIVISQLKEKDNKKIIVRNYYGLNNGIDFFCSLDFYTKDSSVASVKYCLPFVDKEKHADAFRYMYFDNDGDGRWDTFVDSFTDASKTRRYIREGFQWVDTTDASQGVVTQPIPSAQEPQVSEPDLGENPKAEQFDTK